MPHIGNYQIKLKNELTSLTIENKRLKSSVEARAAKIKHLESTKNKLQHGIEEMERKNESLKQSIGLVNLDGIMDGISVEIVEAASWCWSYEKVENFKLKW